MWTVVYGIAFAAAAAKVGTHCLGRLKTMKITALEEYGLRCLLQVARQPDGESISAQAIADREGLSLAYTQKILRILSTGGLIESRRGALGGFALSKSIDELTLGDAMRVLGGVWATDEICDRHTGEMSVCCNSVNCSIRPVWQHISEFVVLTFDSIPLAILTQDEHAVSRHIAGVRMNLTSAELG